MSLCFRYKSGQLCKEIEKVLITEDLKKLAGGEEIGFTVQIDEYEYRNACLDLIVARNKGTYAKNRFFSTFYHFSVDSFVNSFSPLLVSNYSIHSFTHSIQFLL